MFGFGNKKKEEEEREKAEDALMAQMQEQIAQQTKTIQQLQAQLIEAKNNEAMSAQANSALAAAQTQLKQLQEEMQKMKAKPEAAGGKGSGGAVAPAGGKSAGSAGPVGVSRVGPAAGASGGAKPAGPTAGAAAGAKPVSLGDDESKAALEDPHVLAVGRTAYVRKEGGKNLRLRSAAGLQTTVIDGLPPGTQMTLLAGPVDNDGYPWWHIRTSDGREGWVAGTELVTQPQ
ncbi:SH3 type 3 domain protein [Oscillochloris trichoides DG-6]|uniref:SH3 type 3 domain protein n=1 Tax=Oscillochloris trichoides DG-6 TaxID=765420 RepID=E1II35_9CHLR|nr:SH3 domain-containing protein [Oscillochloris trichoides]EFO79153.1 SH3 type 3 domain protein [Oscillochloris trichoides DG-6]